MMRKTTRSATVPAEIIEDVLLISSFGFWAALLGFFPVLAYHGLIGH